MQEQGTRIIRTFKADEIMAAGLAVMAGAETNSVKLATGANVNCIGVTAEAAAAAGDNVAVVMFGEAKVVADAATARHDYVMANASTGKIAPIGATGGTNYHTIGKALEAAAAQNDEMVIFVNPSRSQG